MWLCCLFSFFFLVVVAGSAGGRSGGGYWPSTDAVVEAAAVVCPGPEAYSPCTCYEYGNQPGTIYLYCGEKNLNDSRASEILDAFLTTPGVSPLGNVCFSSNQLTRVPHQLHLFPQLDFVWLNDNNISTPIQSGAFNFNVKDAPVKNLDLQRSQLTSIAPGAFQGVGYSASSSRIALNDNNLKRFESTVFQSMLEKMTPPPTNSSGSSRTTNSSGSSSTAYVQINWNPFECDCHLAWLLRDNRHLLQTVMFGKCSNGTWFTDLDPDAFANCPAFTCPVGYDDFYPDPISCSKYYLCRRENVHHLDCLGNLVFNPEKKRCDLRANVPSCSSSNAASTIRQ